MSYFHKEDWIDSKLGLNHQLATSYSFCEKESIDNNMKAGEGGGALHIELRTIEIHRETIWACLTSIEKGRFFP